MNTDQKTIVTVTKRLGGLPPDPDEMNNQRAGWAHKAVVAFMLATHADFEDAPIDLLANFMHWCDRNDVDFDKTLGRARRLYRDETTPVRLAT